MNLGMLLRRCRKEKGLTLKAVAERIGLSEGFMSQVENNVKSPSLDTLMKICSALDVNAGDLFNQLQKQERLFIIRCSEWDEEEVPHTGFSTRRFISEDQRTTLDSALLHLEPGATIPVRKNIKNGQEVLGVMRGRLELFHGDRVVTLHEGDAVHYWSDPENQHIRNTSDKRAIVIWVGTL